MANIKSKRIKKITNGFNHKANDKGVDTLYNQKEVIAQGSKYFIHQMLRTSDREEL